MLTLWFVANTLLCDFNIDAGGVRIALNVITLILGGSFWILRRGKIHLESALALIPFCIFIGISFLAALSGPCTNLFAKAIFTVPIMLLLLLIGIEIGRVANSDDWSKLPVAARGALLVNFAAFGIQIVSPSYWPFSAHIGARGELPGVFVEPSHFAFLMFPCLAVLLVSEEKRWRIWGWSSLIVCLIFSRSSSLLAFASAWLLYQLVIRFSIRRLMIVAGIGGLTVVVILLGNVRALAPTMSRIEGVISAGSDANVSSLVYIQGWEDAALNLIRTNGKGLGINMMGCTPLPDVPARRLLRAQGLELNSEDGSFLIAKVVSETGILGIVFYAIVIVLWIRFERHIYGKRSNESGAKRVQATIIFCFVVESLTRGAGYFSGSLLLWVVAVSSSFENGGETLSSGSPEPAM